MRSTVAHDALTIVHEGSQGRELGPSCGNNVHHKPQTLTLQFLLRTVGVTYHAIAASTAQSRTTPVRWCKRINTAAVICDTQGRT